MPAGRNPTPVVDTLPADYVKWYHFAKEVLGADLIKEIPDAEIPDWVSRRNWLLFPLPTENKKKDAESRPYPNLYMAIRGGSIQIGLVCNTLKSVERMRNILNPFHAKERTQFLEFMQRLDGDFQTHVQAKLKDFWSDAPKYSKEHTLTSNSIDDTKVGPLFASADKIRAEGTASRLEAGKRYPPKAPIIDVAEVRNLPLNERVFKLKLAQLKPLFKISLEVKTSDQIEEARDTENQEATRKAQEEFIKFQQELDGRVRNGEITRETYRREIEKWSRDKARKSSPM